MALGCMAALYLALGRAYFLGMEEESGRYHSGNGVLEAAYANLFSVR
jgi:hypothetical protein